MMELREIGVVEYWSMQKKRLNSSFSNTPILQCSTTPMLQYSKPLERQTTCKRQPAFTDTPCLCAVPIDRNLYRKR
jgi:hypothetical protein